jgi:hypothetical protein
VPNYLQQDYTATTPHDYLSLIAPLTEGEHIVEAVSRRAWETIWVVDQVRRRISRQGSWA